jgi:hypothetical protein
MTRPPSIELFEKAYFGSLVVSTVALILGWSKLSGQLESELGASGASFGSGLLTTSIVIGYAISLLLWFLIARRASNVAKWILVVLTALGLFGTLTSLFLPTEPKDLNFALNAVATAIGVYAVWLLFKQDAAAWLESKGASGPSDPSTFD